MSILAQTGSLPHPRRKLEEIRAVLKAVRAITRQCLERSIQGLLNRWVGEGLAQASPPWRCSRCGNGERGAFRRNGSYRRQLSTLAGVIILHVPRLRCLCGAHVSLRFPVLEPRRRHWWDVWLQVIEGLGERVSVWPATGGCDRLQRRGVYLSRSTVVRWLACLQLPPLGPIPGVTNEIQVMASTAICGDLCPGAGATTLTPCSSQPTVTPDARRRSWAPFLPPRRRWRATAPWATSSWVVVSTQRRLCPSPPMVRPLSRPVWA